MATTELVRADSLKNGDVIAFLLDRVTSAVTHDGEITVVTLDSLAGPVFAEVPSGQLIRIVAR